jgi:hypothetical protein
MNFTSAACIYIGTPGIGTEMKKLIERKEISSSFIIIS